MMHFVVDPQLPPAAGYWRAFRPAMGTKYPREIDPEQPRRRGIDLKTRFRHYVNLGSMERRIRAFLGDFRWGPMDRVFLNASDEPARKMGSSVQPMVGRDRSLALTAFRGLSEPEEEDPAARE